MSDKRITKKDRFAQLLSVVDSFEAVDGSFDGSDLREFIAHEVALLEKKHGSKGVPTKAQLENEVVKATIASVLADATEPMRATEIGVAIGESVQKATALLKQMVDDGVVSRVQDGKVTKFTL